ncbi:MAG: hypothetical protein KC736_03585 [Candidatus Moranbacteria bacterium]|nr:hypothetical protein [Candidatus Moranbacteria bacterium]
MNFSHIFLRVVIPFLVVVFLSVVVFYFFFRDEDEVVISDSPSSFDSFNDVSDGRFSESIVFLSNGISFNLSEFLSVADEEMISNVESFQFIGRDGSMVLVSQNFLIDAERVTDFDFFVVSEPGRTMPAVNPAYSITFDDLGFAVVLLQEPLEDTRSLAVNDLVSRTGVDRQKLCNLPITVGVISTVNDDLAEQELGLGYCPGSVSLTDVEVNANRL